MSNNLKLQKEKIITLLSDKAVMKQDIFRNTIEAFEMLKICVNQTAIDLVKETDQIDKRITIAVLESKKYSTQLKVAGDILDFFMHTNVFEFDQSNAMFKTGYIKNSKNNSYCGIINVYNFLADSFKYSRLNDLGSLVCRIFVNREMKFFVEAKGVLGIRYSSFSTEPLTTEHLYDIINELIVYVISYDLFVPPLDAVKDVSVAEIQEKVSSINLRTGKRLGYGSASTADDDTNLYI